MTDEQIWTIYYAGIASIRLHPKNDDQATHTSSLNYAAHCADQMLKEHRKRFTKTQEKPTCG